MASISISKKKVGTGVLAAALLYSSGVGAVALYHKAVGKFNAEAVEYVTTRNLVEPKTITVDREVYSKAEVDKQIDAKLQELLK